MYLKQTSLMFIICLLRMNDEKFLNIKEFLGSVYRLD